MEIYCHSWADHILSENKSVFVLSVFYFFNIDRDFTRSFFSGKLKLAGPTADSLLLGQVEIASGKLILPTVSPADLPLKKLISTPDISQCILV